MNSLHPAVIHICTIKMIFEGLNQTKMTEVHFTMYNTILVFLLQNLPEISEWKLLRSKFYTICFSLFMNYVLLKTLKNYILLNSLCVQERALCELICVIHWKELTQIIQLIHWFGSRLTESVCSWVNF